MIKKLFLKLGEKTGDRIVLLLIILAIITRFIGLGLTPAHLSNDEIGAAYDAYSISKTLKDEHNVFLPVTFESHGVYRSALAVYLLVPSIWLFGNTDYSARLPSAVLGSATIIFLGLIVYELTKDKRLAQLTSLVLAFSPWHFLASRSAIEANLALFFVILGIYLFYKGLFNNKGLFTLGAFSSFAISLYGYYTEWGLTPLVIISLLFGYQKLVFKRRIYLLGILIFFILVLPLVVDFINKLAMSRASTELIIHEPGVRLYLDNNSLNLIQKFQVIIKAFLDKYSGYLSLRFLFFNGSFLLPRVNPYQIGLFFSPLIVFFLIGLGKVRKYFATHYLFVYAFLFTTPIVPSLSRGDLSSLRGLPMVIPLSMITALGLYDLGKQKIRKPYLRYLLTGLMIINFFYFFVTYVFHFPVQRAQDFQYGFEQMARLINERYRGFEKIIVDPRFGKKEFYYYGVPHVYFPYYLTLDPKLVQSAGKVENGIAYDKYEFRFVLWENEILRENTLYLVPADNLPTNFPEGTLEKAGEIELPNREIQFVFYRLKENQ